MRPGILIITFLLFLWAKTASAAGAQHVPAVAYRVQRYEVAGTNTLGRVVIDRVMKDATGEAVSLVQIRRALHNLQQICREQGHPLATVTLPRQPLTNGTVIIRIVEEPAPPAPVVAEEIKPPPASTFAVLHYDVIGNTLLKPDTIEHIFHDSTGTNVTIKQIQKAIGELQLAYRERGFATVGVGLPQQQLTNATVKVQVTEGKIVDIRVTGNHYFTSNNVIAAVPSLRTNQILNNIIFQRELDEANKNSDRQIYPVVSPGPEPGTSDLTLKVKDRLPLHARLEANNYNTPNTPDWRGNLSVQYKNLWQEDHQIGLSYGFSPEKFKNDGLVGDGFFNRPLVSNYGAYYRLPFGAPQVVQEQINQSTRFGYDEATHQFRLPPAGDRSDLTVYAAASSQDTGVAYGPAVTVAQTPLLTILSQDTGENLIATENIGGRFNIPVILSDASSFSIGFGADWKRYVKESFNTNNFIITTVVTNSSGSQTIQSRFASPQPPRRFTLDYLPATLSLDFSEKDKHGNLSANLTLSQNFFGRASEFQQLAYAYSQAKGGFGKVTASLTRDQTVFGNWSLLLRANGQVASGALISNEQFALGGISSVRGYTEGEEYGDAGWAGSMELRTPYVARPVPTGRGVSTAWLRGSVFLDAGERWLEDAHKSGSDPWPLLLSTGLTLSANVNNKVDMRFTLGWPLTDSAHRQKHDARVNFSVGGQF